MTTRKEHLLAHGRIDKIGQGRISGKNLDWIDLEYAKGVRFSDWEPGDVKPARKSVEPKSKPKIQKPAPFTGNLEPTPTYTDSGFKLFEMRDGKKIQRSFKEACQHCGVSMYYCICESIGRQPRIVSTNMSGGTRAYVEPV